MRSCTDEVTVLGVVVRIEQVSTDLLLASLQRSHSPANANNSPSLTSKQYGCFAFPGATVRKIRLRGSGTCEISTHRGTQALHLRFQTLH
jgi:hypothetical protein